ncbi:MAG: phytanoyl-CoA dioxygenase family protein [Candidatus Methylacidiphilales bacterium]|nr:phytanoyl-CoA dioxygenase family protein [Candidatus Methylacidiphilales bacterium]
MNTTLSQDQIEKYQQDGFVVQPGFLSSSEVAELKSAMLESIAEMARTQGNAMVAGGGAKMEQKGHYAKVFTQRLNLWRINKTVKSYMLSPDLGKMLCRLADIDGIRVWHDQALIKEPFGNPTSWHLDNPYWSFFSRDAVSVWIALEDATLENGCMWFSPASQKLAAFENVGIGQNIGDLFNVYPAMGEIDPVAAPMKAGDCSFHNGLTAHGAGANMTRKRRMAMTCAYMPAGSTFNGKQNILPEDYFASLKPGDILENDDWNPIVYSKSVAAVALV